MGSVSLSDFKDSGEAILRMLEHYIGDHDYQRLVPIEIALLVVEIAKRAEDRPDWFVRGKWAMIQAIQDRIAIEIAIIMENGHRC